LWGIIVSELDFKKNIADAAVLSNAGLAAAAGGGTLDLGTEIVITAGNTGHPEIWVQITDTIGAGAHAGLSLSVVPLVATDTV
jgi:hypothetical protein